MNRMRIALTISGAVALGAYEGGVLAALISGIRPLASGSDPVIRVDAIGGASAGSITGLLAARCLTTGIDPIDAMRRAWVNGDSIQRMLVGLEDAPLSLGHLRDTAQQLMDPARMKTSEGRQEVPVEMVMVLACLRGLTYQVASGTGRGAAPIEATTFVDLATTEVRSGQDVGTLVDPAGASPLDLALASAANAIGFRPYLIDRSTDASAYRARGTELPRSGELWYTDGGTLDNEPLGHTLDLVGQIDQNAAGDFDRVHVLIHPHPTGVPTGEAWADPDNPPTWLSTLLRADHLQRTQSLYDDLRSVEKINTRIAWRKEVDSLLGPVLEGLGSAEAADLRSALTDALGTIDRDRVDFGSGGSTEQLPEYHEVSLRDLLSLTISRVAGITGKREVGIEVISPLTVARAGGRAVEDVLSGESLMHFGGFFDKRMRDSDFELGYESAVQWLASGALGRHGLDEEAGQAVLTAATAAHTPTEKWRKWGTKSLPYLAIRHPFAFAGVAAQFARVVTRDVVFRHPQ